MKQLIFFTLCLINTRSIAQIETYKVSTNPWNSNGDMNVAVYKPAGYADSPLKVWPVIEFYHGDGDQGTDVNKILNNYIFKLIRDGHPPEAINPITGHLERFIVIEAQDRTGGTVWPENYRKVWSYLINTVKLRVDTTRIYTMGHSYGGDGCILAASWDSMAAKRITAIASLSPHPDLLLKKQNMPFMVKDSIKVWFYSGLPSKDLFTEAAYNFSGLYKNAGGDAMTTIFNGGHDASFWIKFYAGEIKRSWRDREVNVYEWFLTQRKGGYNKTIPPIWPINPEICIGQADQLKKVIVLYKDGRYKEFDSTNWHYPEGQILSDRDVQYYDSINLVNMKKAFSANLIPNSPKRKK